MNPPDFRPRRDNWATVDKAVSLLASFPYGMQPGSGIGVTELARRADLTKSTAFRLLGMLERNGLVDRVGSGYQLGRRLVELGAHAVPNNGDRLREVLTPFLADLYELTHETVQLAIGDATDVLYLAKIYGHRSVSAHSRVGGRAASHSTAEGKALLAYDVEMAEKVLRAPLRALTPATITDPLLLRHELATVARLGVAFDRQETYSGTTAIAVPILASGGKALGALSITGATGRFDPVLYTEPIRRVGRAAAHAVRQAGLSDARPGGTSE